tara:strand:+ start:1866 stop:2375 length:510 start_codon:yes stop_codon:yes gene_type:complete
MIEEINNINKLLKKVLKKKVTPLHEPYFNNRELKKLKECIKSGYVSTVGKSVNLFEKKISKLTKSKHCISVINGTSAIHLGLLALGVKNNDEVLLPTLGFVAVPNAITYCGATPNFVDSEKNTLGVCPKKLHKYLINKSIKKKINYLINLLEEKLRVLLAYIYSDIPII